jgi:predicted PurR-regulated permease PerM
LTDLLTLLSGCLILSYLLLGSVQQVSAVFRKIRFLPKAVCTGLAIFTVYLMLLAVVLVGLVSVAPRVAHQLKELTKDVPGQLHQLEFSSVTTSGHESSLFIPKPPISLVQLASSSNSLTGQEQNRYFNFDFNYKKYLRLLLGYYQQYLSNLGGVLVQLGAGTINGLVYLLTSFVLVFYLLSGGSALKRDTINLLPARYRQPSLQMVNRLHCHFKQVLRGQIVMSLLAGVTMYFVLMILGVKYQLLLSLFFGICSLLPVIGVCIGLFPVLVLSLFGSHTGDLMVLSVTMALFFLLKTYWLTPQLIDEQNRIHPVLLIMTFMICLKLVGVSGLLLFFPLASFLNVLLQPAKTNVSTQC